MDASDKETLTPTVDRGPRISATEPKTPSIEILILSRESLFDARMEFVPGAHIGRPIRLGWFDFVCLIAKAREPVDTTRWPDPEIAKRLKGGWVGGRYEANHRKATKLVSTTLMTLDFDASGNVETVSEALTAMGIVGVVHSTYKSTLEKPRCRAVLRLSEPCANAQEYKRAHGLVRDWFVRLGWADGDIDRAASDCSRLNFWPSRPIGQQGYVMASEGTGLDVARLLGANPVATPKSNPNATPKPDAYRAAALRRASERVGEAGAGEHHRTLFREAAGLARPALGCSDEEIVDALLDAHLRVSRDTEVEARRVLRDAMVAGRAGR